MILDIRPTRGDLRLAEAAVTALAGAGVDLIFAEGEQISRAAMGAAQTVPMCS